MHGSNWAGSIEGKMVAETDLRVILWAVGEKGLNRIDDLQD
jgi:hypothetical protein